MSVMSPAAFRQSRVDYTLYIQNIQLSTQTNVIKKTSNNGFYSNRTAGNSLHL